MVVTAADIAEKPGPLCVKKCPDRGGCEVTTGVKSDNAQPATLAREMFLHQLAQV